MAFNASLSNATILNTPILDTVAHNSTSFLLDQLEETVVIAYSTLDQPVTLSTQWSQDGVTWKTVGTTYSLAAGASLVSNQYDQSLTGIKILAGYLRVVATAGTAPTTGNVTVIMQGMGD